MDKWEYITVNINRIKWEDKDFLSRSPELSKLGEQGWEIIAVSGGYIFLKRKKK